MIVDSFKQISETRDREVSSAGIPADRQSNSICSIVKSALVAGICSGVRLVLRERRGLHAGTSRHRWAAPVGW